MRLDNCRNGPRNAIFTIIFMFFLIFPCVFAYSMESATIADKQLAELYSEYLKQFESKARFDIFDIDRDGVGELLVSENDSHANSVMVYGYDTKAKQVKDIGSFGSNGNMEYDFDTGYIHSGYFGQGELYSEVLSIKDGKVSTEVTLYDNTGTLREYVYEVNDKEVTEQEYEAAKEEYLDSVCILSVGFTTFTNTVGTKDLQGEIEKLLAGGGSTDELIKSAQKRQSMIEQINKKYNISIDLSNGLYEDYDNDGTKELFVSYADIKKRSVVTYYYDGKNIELMESALNDDFEDGEKSTNKSLGECILDFGQAKVYRVTSWNDNEYGQAACSVYKGKPVELIPEKLQNTLDGTRLSTNIYSDIHTLQSFGKVRFYKENDELGCVEGKYISYTPAIYKDGKIYQIESVEIPFAEVAKKKEIYNLLPEIKKEISAVTRIESGSVNEYDTVKVEISPVNMRLNNVLYNDNDYYIFNYRCEMTSPDLPVSKGYKYVDMYAKVTHGQEGYYIEEAGGGNIGTSFDGFDILKTTKWK